MNKKNTLAAFRRSILKHTLLAGGIAFIFACSNDKDDETPPSISSSLLLNFTSDYESGELRWMGTNSQSLEAGSLSFEQDSKVFAHNGKIFLLERIYSNLSCLEPQSIFNESAIVQRSLESGSNPYEVAVAGGKGFIALNGADYIQVFDANTCVLGEKINLPISEANASSIKVRGDTLFVVLQRLEFWSATKPGLLVRINANTKALIDTIQLNFYNPGFSILSNGKLYVSSQKYNEDYSVDLEKSGIEIVDLSSGASEVLFTGVQLGGGANGIALDENAQILYSSIYANWGDAPVKPINLSSKSIYENLYGIADSFNGLVFDSESKKLFVAEASGLKIYDTAAKTTTTVDNDLPPYSLAIVRW